MSIRTLIPMKTCADGPFAFCQSVAPNAGLNVEPHPVGESRNADHKSVTYSPTPSRLRCRKLWMNRKHCYAEHAQMILQLAQASKVKFDVPISQAYQRHSRYDVVCLISDGGGLGINPTKHPSSGHVDASYLIFWVVEVCQQTKQLLRETIRIYYSRRRNVGFWKCSCPSIVGEPWAGGAPSAPT
jgi:hypothetical protein